jgi:hypothetical protein
MGNRWREIFRLDTGSAVSGLALVRRFDVEGKMPKQLSPDDIKGLGDLDSLDDATLDGLAKDLREKAKLLESRKGKPKPGPKPLDCKIMQCIAGSEII